VSKYHIPPTTLVARPITNAPTLHRITPIKPHHLSYPLPSSTKSLYLQSFASVYPAARSPHKFNLRSQASPTDTSVPQTCVPHSFPPFSAWAPPLLHKIYQLCPCALLVTLPAPGQISTNNPANRRPRRSVKHRLHLNRCSLSMPEFRRPPGRNSSRMHKCP